MIFLKWWKILLVLILGVIVWWTGWPAYQGYFNTDYSIYYREDRFLDVRLGDNEDYVVGVLGEPIDKGWADGNHIFYYSLPKSTGYFYDRKLIFYEAKVVEKKSRLDSKF